jgi:hypothetical protein
MNWKYLKKSKSKKNRKRVREQKDWVTESENGYQSIEWTVGRQQEKQGRSMDIKDLLKCV